MPETRSVSKPDGGMRLIGRVMLAAFILALPIIDAPSPEPTAVLMLENPFIKVDFLLHVLCLGFGYLNYFFLIPNLLYAGKTWLYGLLVTATFLLLCSIPHFFFDYSANGSAIVFPVCSLIQIRHIFFLFGCIFLFSTLTKTEEHRRILQRQKEAAELRYLKAQINPHFLFNTLNSIYALCLTDADRAADAVLNLSDTMRYVLETAHMSAVSASREIAFIDNYIALQKTRFGAGVNIEYRVQHNDRELHVAPLTIIPFVENAFKYGVDTRKVCDIKIDLRTQDGKLFLWVNNEDFRDRVNYEQSTGVGLNNTQARLELLYRGHYNLVISRAAQHFDVQLEIDTRGANIDHSPS